MRVLIVVDKPGSAIDRMAQARVKSCPWHKYTIVAVHPKRPSTEQLKAFNEAAEKADIIDYQYWKTAEFLISTMEINKPRMLTHHNPYDLTRKTWHEYKLNVVLNSEQQRVMQRNAITIPHAVDLEFFDYKPYEKSERPYDVLMVSSRIEGKKGVLPVAEVCGEMGLKMALVGDISDTAYYEKAIATGAVEFFHNIPDEQLRDLYHKSKIHICNSIDNFESGTMPILEAMSCGTPVVTRKIGHVPDTNNGRNMLVRRGAPDDKEDLKNAIEQILSDDTYAKSLSYEGRISLRLRGLELYAWRYSRLYHKLLTDEELITVVLPVASGPEKWSGTLARILAQDIKDLEVIIVDDGEFSELNRQFVEGVREETSRTIKYYHTAQYAMDENNTPYKTYGLARARNKAMLEAEGVWLAFVDERMHLEPGALKAFYDRRKDKHWLWGVKDDNPKSFVENFSFVKRKDLIMLGGFNEQITQYGGMTQDTRNRAEPNGMKLEMVSEARAKSSRKSSNSRTKTLDIAKSKTQCYKLYG